MDVWLLSMGAMVFGIVIGYVLAVVAKKKKPVGTLRVDHSIQDEAPYLFLELEPNGMDRIRTSKTVLVNVDLNSYLTRK